MRAAHALRPLAHLRARGEPRSSRALVRLSARIIGSRLDRDLACGVPPWRSPYHAARALQLTSDRSRAAFARSLETLVEHAETPPTLPLRTPYVLPCREQVRDALAELTWLSARLRDSAPLGASGVARLAIILRHGAGPCYRSDEEHALSAALEEVRCSIDVEV
jgi:hypothetical protein